MKNFFQMLLLTGTLFVTCLQNARAAEIIKIVPGKSLGSVSLGENRDKLLDLGFGPDGATDPQEYLQYNGVLVRLSDDKVAQIYADAKTLKRLRFHNKKLPKNTSAKSLKTFFQHCGKQIKTSAGILVYCEKHGIELTYNSMKGQLQGLAIVSAKPAKASKSAKSKKSTLALPKKTAKKVKKTTPLPEKIDKPEKSEVTEPTLEVKEPKQEPKEQPSSPPAEDEQSLENEVESMPSQPETAPPPAVAPADSPAPSDSATKPEGKTPEKADDPPFED